MLEHLFKRHPTIRRILDSWLYEPLNNYVTDRLQGGYSRLTVTGETYLLLRLAEFAKRRGICEAKALPQCVDEFLEPCQNRVYRVRKYQGIQRFFHYLQGQGILPEEVEPPEPFADVVAGYREFMQERRNLSARTIVTRMSMCRHLLRQLHDSGLTDIGALSLGSLQEYIIARGNRCTRGSMISLCSDLRDFLRYLYRTRMILTDIAAQILAPRAYTHERCPRFLEYAEVHALLDAVDRATGQGRRDYAMLLLLANYALRGIEVVRLRLDDIDWQADKLQIRGRKAGNSSAFALTPTVGNAILAYLQDGRPASRRREVFLSVSNPPHPLTTSALGHAVKRHLTKAGIDRNGFGAHTLRYSCAQRLFVDNFSIKEIGDYLGHRKLTSTQRYLKIDLTHLREVAVNAGEDLL